MSATFWNALATYCEHLTPVASQLVAGVGATARAVDNANRTIAQLDSDIAYFERLNSASPEDE